MTEKRFIPIFDGADKRVVGAKDNGKIISFGDMFELLNEQHEQICQLKNELEDALLDVKIYKNANTTFDNVYQENEKLKSRIEYLERKIQRERNATTKQHLRWSDEAEIKIKELSEENEELKFELKECREHKLYSRRELEKENKQLKQFQDRVFQLIDEMINDSKIKVEELRKDAYEKGYAYNPYYYYWRMTNILEELKKQLKWWALNDA